MAHYERNGKTDEWYTPKYVFDALGVEFDQDVAAPDIRQFCHVPAQSFITSGSLQKEWSGFVWMNPPFGSRMGLVPWLDKIYKHGNGIALTPDRTSAPWWTTAAKQADALLFVNHKIKFIRDDGTIGRWPGNGTTLFAYGSKALSAIRNATKNGLGTYFEKPFLN